MANPNPTHKFQPGVVTNPNGAPKKELAMTEALKDLLLIKDPIKKIEHYKLLLEKALQLAMRGDGDMIKYLVNRIDGMPKGSGTELNIDNRSITFIGSEEQNKEIDEFVISRVKQMIKDNLIKREEL
jgi:hypothetical protein